MAVDTVLSALGDILPDYTLIRDCIVGERAIKKQRTKYLPHPDPDAAATPAGIQRYSDYLLRAVFYNVTNRTLGGLVGLVFDKDPVIEAPELLAPVIADAAGDGMSLDEQAQASLRDNMAVARGGIFVDYPPVEAPTTIADARAGNIRPTINLYKAENIINWRTRTFGSRVLLSLVVLRETYVIEDDGFAEQTATQHRVLRLTQAGDYFVEIYRDGTLFDRRVPTDGAGQPFREIPFTFFGIEDNSPSVDQPPLLPIAQLNIAHYRNSADYEESVFLVGQPTPVFAGLTKQWVEDVFTEEVDDGHGSIRKQSTVRLGSRAAVPLPEGGSAELLQADPNTMAKEAMEHKEAQMLALGAKLIENTGTQQTATEATIDAVLDNSVLATAARNVSKAYRQALRWAFQYMTGQIVDDPEVIDYELSNDFSAKLLTAADRADIVASWQKRAISFEEMRWGLRRAGTAYLSDEDAKAQIEQEKEATIAFEAEAATALADAGAPRQPAPGN